MIPEPVYRAIMAYTELNDDSVVLTGKRSRCYIRDILRARGLKTAVVAQEELVASIRVNQIGSIELPNDDSEEVLHALAA